MASGLSFDILADSRHPIPKPAPRELLADATFQDLTSALKFTEPDHENEAGSMTEEIVHTFQMARAYGRKIESEMSAEELKALINGGDLKTPKTEEGRGKTTYVDSWKWTKVVHPKSLLAINFFNVDKVNPQSEHMHRIRANIHFNSGKHIEPEDYEDPWMQKKRERGRLFGRDILEVYYKENPEDPDGKPEIVRVEFHVRPRKGDTNYWYEWKLASLRSTSLGKFVKLGMVPAIAQMGAIWALDHYLRPLFGHTPEPTTLRLMAFTFIYGSLIGGIFNPCTRPIFARLTRTEKFFARGIPVSLPYAIGYKLIRFKGEAVKDVLTTLKTTFDIGVNFGINNYVNRILGMRTELDEELRRDHTNLKILGVDTGVTKLDAKFQWRYLTRGFLPRLGDLDNHGGTLFEIDTLDYKFTRGKLIFLAIAPIEEYRFVRRAEKMGSARAQEYRENFERTPHGFALRLLANAYKATRASLKDFGEGIQTAVSGNQPLSEWASEKFRQHSSELWEESKQPRAKTLQKISGACAVMFRRIALELGT